MTASNVYFTNMRLAPTDSVPKKLKRLIKAAGFADLELEGKFVAIKTHVGEQGNVSHLRPEYTRAIAEEIKRLGGKPFLTDTSTLYPGMRNDAPSHLGCAELNGFNSISCGCQMVIADGLRGTDEVNIPVEGSEYITEAHIGRAIADTDVLVTLTHAKGCTAAAYGGVLKNISMGCASKAGKMAMHCSEIPRIIADKCVGCGLCRQACGQDAIQVIDGKAQIGEACAGCGHCISYCPHGAIMPAWSGDRVAMHTKMAEYAAAVVKTVPQTFHVAIAIDITPQCDCFAGNDTPMVPNIGMFASTDPVAMDQAITDAINAQTALESAVLPERHTSCEEGLDHLHALNPDSDWTLSIRHAEELGIGTREYKLITID